MRNKIGTIGYRKLRFKRNTWNERSQSVIGKKRYKVNINDFRFTGIGLLDKSVEDLLWRRQRTDIAGVKVNLGLPYMDGKYAKMDGVDLRRLRFCNSSWIGAIPVTSHGSIDYTKKGLWTVTIQKAKMRLIMLLEANFWPERYGHLVKTPPGRPGNPMTILADINGNIVPSIPIYPGTDVRLYFLDHDWASFGFNNRYPAIALQVMEKFPGTEKAMKKHQEYLKRNKA